MAKRKRLNDAVKVKDSTSENQPEQEKGVKVKGNRKGKFKKQKNSDAKEPTKVEQTNEKPAQEVETWSKSKKKRMRKLRGRQHEASESDKLPTSGQPKKSETPEQDSPEIADAAQGKKSSLQGEFKSRLSGSRFRILNEELYTTVSTESYSRFRDNPELFEQYHEGFRHQVESWPVNPIDILVKWITKKYGSSKCLVADFGCGDAQLAKDLLASQKLNKKSDFKVHSFDMVSNNELVTACDMANVPLENKSVDVCIFCLSLMGTNLADFIREAHRVLKDDGRVKIAEVRSRIEYSNAAGSKNKKGQQSKSPHSKKKGEADGDKGTVREFVNVLDKLGFTCVDTDRSNKMFLTLELKKHGKAPNKKLEFSARPCIYKRR